MVSGGEGSRGGEEPIYAPGVPRPRGPTDHYRARGERPPAPGPLQRPGSASLPRAWTAPAPGHGRSPEASHSRAPRGPASLCLGPRGAISRAEDQRSPRPALPSPALPRPWHSPAPGPGPRRTVRAWAPCDDLRGPSLALGSRPRPRAWTSFADLASPRPDQVPVAIPASLAPRLDRPETDDLRGLPCAAEASDPPPAPGLPSPTSRAPGLAWTRSSGATPASLASGARPALGALGELGRPPPGAPGPRPPKGQIIGTGGRISVDRSSKATLPLTIPRPIFKSSAKDSSPRSSGIAMQSTRARLLPPARGSSRHMLLGVHRHSY
jgi:hypothetical protein